MLSIERQFENNVLLFKLEGRLDTLTSPELESELEDCPVETEEIIMDFEKLDYISSAGLRVLLKAHKAMKEKKGVRILNANESVRNIFEITGFDRILNME